MTDPITLRNRFAMAKGAWDEHLRGVPFPSSLGDGTAEEKIERLEIALVDEMRSRATPETAEQVTDLSAVLDALEGRAKGLPLPEAARVRLEVLQLLKQADAYADDPRAKEFGTMYCLLETMESDDRSRLATRLIQLLRS